jgi:hypothetical protein
MTRYLFVQKCGGTSPFARTCHIPFCPVLYLVPILSLGSGEFSIPLLLKLFRMLDYDTTSRTRPITPNAEDSVVAVGEPFVLFFFPLLRGSLPVF